MQKYGLTLIKISIRYNQTVVDFILRSQVTLVPRFNIAPLALALIQELFQIRALYWLNTLFAVKF